MAAGDLENIVLTSPDSADQKSSRVRNIIWRDHNNVNRSVKYVYWCPDGQRARLVWQRDHGPVVYPSLNNTNIVLFKWVCPTGVTTITSADSWVEQSSTQSFGFSVCDIRDIEQQGQVIHDVLYPIGYDTQNGDFSRTTDSTILYSKNSQTLSSVHVSISNRNISVTPGKTYWICLYDTKDQQLAPSLVKPTGTSDYILYNDQIYKLFQAPDYHNAITNYSIVENGSKIYAKVNGVEV